MQLWNLEPGVKPLCVPVENCFIGYENDCLEGNLALGMEMRFGNVFGIRTLY